MRESGCTVILKSSIIFNPKLMLSKSFLKKEVKWKIKLLTNKRKKRRIQAVTTRTITSLSVCLAVVRPKENIRKNFTLQKSQTSWLTTRKEKSKVQASLCMSPSPFNTIQPKFILANDFIDNDFYK